MGAHEIIDAKLASTNQDVLSPRLGSAEELLASTYASKGYAPEAVAALDTGNIGGRVYSHYFLGDVRTELGEINQNRPTDLAQRIVRKAGRLTSRADTSYTGSIEENAQIRQADYGVSYPFGLARNLRRNGTQRKFISGGVDVQVAEPRLHLDEVPIAVVGAGAAGILAARAFVEIGFQNVAVYDKRGMPGGIWNQDNVGGGSKNNPVPMEYDGSRVSSAREFADPQGTGRDVRNYIRSIADGTSSRADRPYRAGQIAVQQANVTGIEPGDLDHAVHFGSGSNETVRHYPIVLFAPGNGRPLPLSHDGHMVTSATRSEAGVRWQQQLSPEQLFKLKDKKVTIVGLGNSAAEMMYQFDQAGIDYTVLTHYSPSQVQRPDLRYVNYPDPLFRGKSVFRDISLPELTSFACDLPHLNRVYFRALSEGRIIPGIGEWQVERGRVVAMARDGSIHEVPTDVMYTLTGYGQDPATLERMGIICTNEYAGTGAFDFDGEVQENQGVTGRDRVHAGYFALGPILKDRENINAVVIPGIQGQLPDLLTGVVMRAAEYAYANRDPSRRWKDGRMQMATRRLMRSVARFS